MSFFEKLKAKGSFFNNMFSSTSSTTPSLATVLTGLYPQKHGILSTYGHVLTPESRTAADVLKASGYHCSASVSGPLMPITRLNSGFDQYNFYKPMKTFKLSRWAIQFKQMDAIDKKVVKNFREITKRQDPWFHWIHLLDLHNRWRHTIHDKPGATQYERALVKLNDLLENLGQLVDFSNTIVFVVADHGHYVADLDGPMDGIHYEEAHGFQVYDLLTRVPFIACSPLHKFKSAEVSMPTSTVDILPTLIEMLGIESSQPLDGQSLLPLLMGDGTGYVEKPVFLQACGAILKKQGAPFLYSIRQNGWKLVTSVQASSFKPQLFNLLEDPGETVNVVSQHADVQARLKHVLSGYVTDVN
jgi:arylsulfatase A-like enzyme